jgi:hypothetical protein
LKRREEMVGEHNSWRHDIVSSYRQSWQGWTCDWRGSPVRFDRLCGRLRVFTLRTWLNLCWKYLWWLWFWLYRLFFCYWLSW